MKPFEDVRILEVTLTRIGNSAMWDAALQILPLDENDRDRPVIARVTDGNGNHVCITRLNGIPIMVGTNLPQRLSATALDFQTRWQATPPEKQTMAQFKE